MRNYRGKTLNNAVKIMMVLLMSFCLVFVINGCSKAKHKVDEAYKAKDVNTLIQKLRDKDPNVRGKAAEALENINNLRLLLLEAFPHLFCKVCHLRAEKKKIRIGILKKHTYVCCRSCGSSSHLIKGIREVIGLIGGNVDDYRIDGDKFYVNLWDNENKKARNADIDVLEIRNSPNINYGLAIANVCTRLVNDVSRPRDWIKNIPVVLTGNPPIPKDSMKDLKRRFREVKKVEG